jgi:glycosyltransferase involved in cell wall biosynthesis
VSLLLELDHVGYGERPLDEIVALVSRQQPLWIRVANFFTPTFELLQALPRPTLVYWKLEFWGTDLDQFPRSDGVDPARFAEAVLRLGHHVVPYTFNEWNRAHIVSRIPVLAAHGLRVQPIAQKPLVPETAARDALRARFGATPDDTVFGVGGLLHPAKRIEEVVAAFLRAPDDDRKRLLVQVIADQTAVELVDTWQARYGRRAGLTVRTGDYGRWQAMAEFYRAIDCLLVNSRSESWGRMVTEAIGYGVPVVVQRAECATNHIVPGLVIVDDVTDWTGPERARAVARAQAQAETLAAFVERHYATPVVRRRCLEILRAATPPGRLAEFDALCTDAVELRAVDASLTF